MFRLKRHISLKAIVRAGRHRYRIKIVSDGNLELYTAWVHKYISKEKNEFVNCYSGKRRDCKAFCLGVLRKIKKAAEQPGGRHA